MTILASTFVPDKGYFSGGIFRMGDNFEAALQKRIVPPPFVSTIDRIPSGCSYGNRHYLVGGHTANLVIDELFRCSKQSISAPNVKPSVTAGAGAVNQIAYIRFYDEITQERSPLSEGTVFTGNVSRSWTSLPTEVPDEQVIVEGLATIAGGAVTGSNSNYSILRPGDRIATAAAPTRWAQIRSIADNGTMALDDTGMAAAAEAIIARPFSRVSHVELWVSVDGSLPRIIMRVRKGTTAVSEAVATLALGEAEVSSFEAMPFSGGAINLIYNDRQVIAGVEGHRDTIYLSAIGFPERHEGLRFITKYNEPIVGMFKFRDYVVVLCPDSSYKLQGYTEDDFTLTVLEPKVGGLGHHGNKVTETYAVVPGRKAMQIFNGAFHPGMPTRQKEWVKRYRARPELFKGGWAVVNSNDETYQFYPQWEVSVTAGVLVGHYDAIQSQAGGTLSPLEWTSDTHYTATPDPDGIETPSTTTFAAYITPAGLEIGFLLRGDGLGRITREMDNPPEDNDVVTFHHDSYIVLPHYLLGDHGGNLNEGKKLIRGWSYVVSELSAWRVSVWPGDEYAYGAELTPNGDINLAEGAYIDEVVASESASPSANQAPKTVHVHQIEVQGRGFTYEYKFIKPCAGTRFIGIGGVWSVGVAGRRPRYIIDVE